MAQVCVFSKWPVKFSAPRNRRVTVKHVSGGLAFLTIRRINNLRMFNMARRFDSPHPAPNLSFYFQSVIGFVLSA
jgi:hypothetical protein